MRRQRRRGPTSASFGFCASLLTLAVSLVQGTSPDPHVGLKVVGSTNLPDPHAGLKVDPAGLKVVGSTNLPVKVYVKAGHNGPRILCLTDHLRNSELIDPIFQWHGPGGDLVTENQTVKISPTGTLLFRHFRDDMSGVYTCSLVFKPTAEQAEKNYLIKYIVYAYSDPTSYYEVSARYHAAPCNSIYNTSFVKKMLQALGQVIARLSCEITLRKSECHRVKMQRAGLQNQIFLTFMVSYLDAEKSSRNTCTKNACDVTRRLRKAKDIIEKFFNQQIELVVKKSSPLPEVYFIEGTLQIVWVSHCVRGYGINPLLHPHCPNCCVICSPGSFNPQEGVHCLPCNKSLEYGATHC